MRSHATIHLLQVLKKSFHFVLLKIEDARMKRNVLLKALDKKAIHSHHYFHLTDSATCHKWSLSVIFGKSLPQYRHFIVNYILLLYSRKLKEMSIRTKV